MTKSNKCTVFEYRRAQTEHGLIANRVGMINQFHGCRYDHATGNPCVLVSYGGNNREVWYLGDRVCSYSLLDAASVTKALVIVEALERAVWLIRSAGLLLKRSCCGD